MKRKFLPILILLFSISSVMAQVNITFEVNTAALGSVDPAGIFIAGGTGFGNPGDNPLTDPDGDGIWTTTVIRDLGFSSFYTFTNGNCPNYSCKEDIGGLPCADPNNFNDRFLPAVMSDTTIQACYGNCADDGTCDVISLPTLPMDFESTDITYAPIGFGAATSALVPNPNMDTDNGSATVWNVTKVVGGQPWAGASIDLAGPMNFSNTSTIKIKFYSDFSGIPVQVKIEDITDPMNIVSAEVIVNTTVEAGWETLVFDMSTSTIGTFDPMIEYTRFVVFPDYQNIPFIGDIPFYFDDAELDVAATVLPTLPITFEDPNITYDNLPFGDLVSSVITNPDASGDNTSATVLSLEKVDGAQTWAGATLPLASAIDWSNGTTLTAKVWSPEAGTPFLLKIEDLTDPMNIVSAEVLANS
ncbi:MAG: hypothetical protein AB8F94_30050, partial [Saprospiraceae bacterium]